MSVGDNKTSGMVLRPNGCAVLRFDNGDTVALRRPKLGEYRALRTLAIDNGDSLRWENDQGERVLVDDSENVAIDLAIEWFRTLESHIDDNPPIVTDGHFPSDNNDFDLWLLLAGAQVKLFAHWQVAPLDLGN